MSNKKTLKNNQTAKTLKPAKKLQGKNKLPAELSLTQQKKKSVVIKPRRDPKFTLPFLHKKRFAIPLLLLAALSISGLLLLPNLPQVQSTAQSITKNHPMLAKIVPPSFKPPDTNLPTTGNWLVIPAIDIKMAIIEGPNIDVLIKQVGVWHQTGEQTGNYSLAGHRLQYFRSVNQSLYHLDELHASDSGIFIVTNGVARQYKVTNKRVVNPTNIAILDPTPTSQLTIYTCNDFNNNSRLVVTAIPL